MLANISRIGLVAAAVMLLHAGPARAAGAFEAELGADPAKAVAKAKISMMNGDNDGRESGSGLTPYLKKLGKPPARVALVSFYVWDVGNTKSKTYRFINSEYTYRVSNTRSFNVGTTELSVLATELHDAAVPALKQSFAAVGMQLLTPAEFADTPAKKQAYDSYKWEAGGFTNLMKSLQGKGGLEWSRGTPDGYKLIEMFTRGSKDMNDYEFALNGIGVGKFGVSVGYDLARALEVDAVVIMYGVVQAEKNSINMLGTGLYMFGPNPIPESGQSMYYSGHQYSGLYLKLKEIPLIQLDKQDKVVAEDLKGFGPVAGAMGARMAAHIKAKTG